MSCCRSRRCSACCTRRPAPRRFSSVGDRAPGSCWRRRTVVPDDVVPLWTALRRPIRALQQPLAVRPAYLSHQSLSVVLWPCVHHRLPAVESHPAGPHRGHRPVAHADTRPSFGEFALCAWVITVIGFFSLSWFKLDTYIFPAAPAICLLAATRGNGRLTTDRSVVCPRQPRADPDPLCSGRGRRLDLPVPAESADPDLCGSPSVVAHRRRHGTERPDGTIRLEASCVRADAHRAVDLRLWHRCCGRLSRDRSGSADAGNRALADPLEAAIEGAPRALSAGTVEGEPPLLFGPAVSPSRTPKTCGISSTNTLSERRAHRARAARPRHAGSRSSRPLHPQRGARDRRSRSSPPALGRRSGRGPRPLTMVECGGPCGRHLPLRLCLTPAPCGSRARPARAVRWLWARTERPGASSRRHASPAQIAALSEPDGYFDTDNLISNEQCYLSVLPDIERAGPGRRIRRRRPGSELLLHRRRPAERRVHHRHPARQPAAPPAVQGALLAVAHAGGLPVAVVRTSSPAEPDLWRARNVAALTGYVDTAPAPDRAASTRFARASRRRCGRSASHSAPGTCRQSIVFTAASSMPALGLRFQSLGRPPQATTRPSASCSSKWTARDISATTSRRRTDSSS